MKITVCDEKTGGLTLDYEENIWTGRRTLTYNGEKLVRKNNKSFLLPASQERGEAEFRVTGNAFAGVTVASEIFSGVVTVRRKLSALEYILAVLPLIPSVFFGAVGGAIGGLFMALSLCCMTRIETLWLKIVVGIELGAIGGLLAFWTAYGVALLLV